jgi:predicted acylesterase/phospholipase RssA
MKPIYFNHKSHPDIDILSLLRITTSIPLLFQSVEYDGNIYCDGGLYDNFPINYANTLSTKLSIIGIRLNPRIKFIKIDNILDYVHAIMKIVAHRILFESTNNYKNIIINIDTSITQYDTLNIIMKTHSMKSHIHVCDQMFQEGYNQCTKIYLSNRIAKNRRYKYKND